MTSDARELVDRLHALADQQRRERGDVMYLGEHDPEISEAASTIQSLSERIAVADEDNRLLKLAVGFAQSMLASHGHADEAQKIRDLTKEQTNG